MCAWGGLVAAEIYNINQFLKMSIRNPDAVHDQARRRRRAMEAGLTGVGLEFKWDGLQNQYVRHMNSTKRTGYQHCTDFSYLYLVTVAQKHIKYVYRPVRSK